MKQNNTYIFLLRKDYILYEKEKNLYNKHCMITSKFLDFVFELGLI